MGMATSERKIHGRGGFFCLTSSHVIALSQCFTEGGFLGGFDMEPVQKAQ
jgi:hypothetical protein